MSALISSDVAVECDHAGQVETLAGGRGVLRGLQYIGLTIPRSEQYMNAHPSVGALGMVSVRTIRSELRNNT